MKARANEEKQENGQTLCQDSFLEVRERCGPVWRVPRGPCFQEKFHEGLANWASRFYSYLGTIVESLEDIDVLPTSIAER
ncbi:hypothetical protein L1987_48416 [Smallanthus sonchifolius]|uniref:Uncharacterized protein n=1 Tax=Smallanthus sonchifolius TaxID=185202 RepID=A0ACB9FTJ1_9ASTR|nr:hypothetical protein L1987_48416 [Smallanthus sonchifolius]